MLVNLKRKWFAPTKRVQMENVRGNGAGFTSVSGTMYDPRQNPHKMPDELRDYLPSDAQILADDGKVEAVVSRDTSEPMSSLREYDGIRAAMEAEQTLRNSLVEPEAPEEDDNDAEPEDEATEEKPADFDEKRLASARRRRKKQAE